MSLYSNESEIFKLYADYLKALDITFYDRQGFSVRYERPAIGWGHIDLIDGWHTNAPGSLYIHNYVGLIDGGTRRQQKVIRELRAHFAPGYEFYEEWPEFGMGQAFSFTDLDDLHKRVEALADNLDEAYQLARELLEGDIHR